MSLKMSKDIPQSLSAEVAHHLWSTEEKKKNQTTFFNTWYRRRLMFQTAPYLCAVVFETVVYNITVNTSV